MASYLRIRILITVPVSMFVRLRMEPSRGAQDEIENSYPFREINKTTSLGLVQLDLLENEFVPAEEFFCI
jgi:hypothetical protein